MGTVTGPRLWVESNQFGISRLLWLGVSRRRNGGGAKPTGQVQATRHCTRHTTLIFEIQSLCRQLGTPGQFLRLGVVWLWLVAFSVKGRVEELHLVDPSFG